MYGKRLKKLREELNLKQSELAKTFNISSSAIGMYERKDREPNIDLILKFSDFFNVSTDYLLGNTNNKNLDDASSKINTGLSLNDYKSPNETQQKQIEEFAKLVLKDNRKV